MLSRMYSTFTECTYKLSWPTFCMWFVTLSRITNTLDQLQAQKPTGAFAYVLCVSSVFVTGNCVICSRWLHLSMKTSIEEEVWVMTYIKYENSGMRNMRKRERCLLKRQTYFRPTKKQIWILTAHAVWSFFISAFHLVSKEEKLMTKDAWGILRSRGIHELTKSKEYSAKQLQRFLTLIRAEDPSLFEISRHWSLVRA